MAKLFRLEADAPSAVVNAFAQVQRQFPEVMTVSFDHDLRWNYQLKDGTSPNFEGKIDVEVLEHAADALTQSEVVYYRGDMSRKDVITLLWQALGRVPTTDDLLEEQFALFHAGDHKFQVWSWFESLDDDFSVAKGGFV